MKRRYTRNSPHTSLQRFWVAGALILSLILFIRMIHTRPVSWWKFQTDGEIFSQPVFDHNRLFVATSYASVYALDKITGHQDWIYTASAPVSEALLLWNDSVIVQSEDGVIAALNVETWDERWRFSDPQQYRFTSSMIAAAQRIIVANANGRIYALNPRDGRVLWKFDASPPQRLSNLPIQHGVSWQSSLTPVNNTVYYAGPDSHLYALNAVNGSLLWKFAAGSAITTPVNVLGNRVYIGNKEGDSFVLHRTTGRITWQQSGSDPVVCLMPVYPLQELTLLISNPFFDFVSGKLKTLIPWRVPVLRVSANGMVSLVDASGTRVVWSRNVPGTTTFCPQKWFSTLYLTSTKALHAISMKTGDVRWTHEIDGEFHSSPGLTWRTIIVDIRRRYAAAFVPLLITTDSHGTVSVTDGRSGNNIWQTRCNGRSFRPPVLHGRHMYFTCTDGGVYTVAFPSGDIALPLPPITVTEHILQAGQSRILELTLTHPDSGYSNPQQEVNIEAIFRQNDLSVPVRGFYYDRNTWKIRFNPPEKGPWHWTVTTHTPAGRRTNTGSFTSETDTRLFYFRIPDNAPYRISTDGTTVFNGVGIGDQIRDTNGNGNPLDDWATGTDQPYIATMPASTRTYPSDLIVPLRTYTRTYGNGVFNIFRWSIDNASFALWDTSTYARSYRVAEGKYGDSLIAALTNDGFHVWLTLFGTSVPFSKTQLYSEREAIRQYVRYIVARYGAFVSMWEIANEAYINDELVRFIADEIRSEDFHNRPIGMSWEHPDVSSVSVVTPHWYETENVQSADTAVITQIQKYAPYHKPILFGEVGNTVKNWDESSALRMRVRTWTAFFHNAILVFWNTSSDKNYYNPVIKNANQFIGPQERSFIQSFVTLTQAVHLSAHAVPIPTYNPQVRSYGLISEHELMGYFFHFADPYRNTSVSARISLPKNARVTWLDPSTGRTLSEMVLPRGSHNISSPEFTADIALKAEFAK